MLWRSRESRPSRTSVTVAPPAVEPGTTTVDEEPDDVVVDLDHDTNETSVNDEEAEVTGDGDSDDTVSTNPVSANPVSTNPVSTNPVSDTHLTDSATTDATAAGASAAAASAAEESAPADAPTTDTAFAPTEVPVDRTDTTPMSEATEATQVTEATETVDTADTADTVVPAPAPPDPQVVAPSNARTRVGPAIVIAVANQKGGVGKTTTTVSLAAALADKGVRVLVVDLDPQGNATTGLGGRATQDDATSYDVLLDEATVADATIQTEVAGLHLVPASLDLAGAEIELVPAFSREARLRKAIADIRSQYDIVMIDCPPSLGLITINALVAADRVLVPIQCEYYALEGLGQLMKTVELVAGNLNNALELGGIAMTMYDARTKLSQQVVDEVRNHFDDLVFETVIPRTVRLSEAPSFGQPITVFDPASRGARAYRRLGDEVARRFDLLDAEPAPSTSALDRLLGTSGMTSTTVRPDPDEDTGAWT